MSSSNAAHLALRDPPVRHCKRREQRGSQLVVSRLSYFTYCTGSGKQKHKTKIRY
jgi:hypothetical protein